MLTCESAACRAAICVDINPLLSSESASKLARRYRTMLATAHAPTCPFRSDAERWLLDEESKHQSDGFAVPPYLLSMSDDYALLENVLQHGGGLVSRKMIRLAAIELSEQFEKADMGVANLSLTVPQTAIDLMKEEAVATALGDGATVKSLAGVVYSALGEELSEDNVDAGLVKVLNDDDDLTTEFRSCIVIDNERFTDVNNTMPSQLRMRSGFSSIFKTMTVVCQSYYPMME